MGNIIGLIIFGAVIGFLARFFMKGKQPISAIETVLLGIIGAVGGYYLAAALGVKDTNGIDWIRDTISIVISILAITVYCAIRGRAKSV